MASETTEIRLPMTWEANLLVALMLIITLLGGVIAGTAGPSSLYIVSQLLFIVPGLIWMAIRRYPLRSTLRLNGINGRTAIWSALIGLACWPISAGLGALVEQGLSFIGPGIEISPPKGAIESIIYAVVVIFLAPITEEPIFRGFVMSAWLRRGILPGLLVSSFLFSSVHLSDVYILPVIFLGIVFGFLVHRTNSLYSSIIAHMCCNTMGTLFFLTPSLRNLSDWIFIAAGSLAIPIAFLLLRSLANQFPARLERLPADRSRRIWTVLSLLVVLVILGSVLLVQLFMRLNPAGVGV